MAEIQTVGPPPTTERGSAGSIAGVIPAWSQLQTFVDWDEQSPEVTWPESVLVYDKMFNDTQVKGLYMGTVLPIHKYRWYLKKNGARPELVKKISQDYGLPVEGEEEINRPRLRNRFNFKRHREDALRALYMGHYYFEQYGAIGDDGLWHVRKLAPRKPRSIAEILVAEDGGLEGIKQAVGPEAPLIDVGRLVAYIWDQEAGNWVGRSMLRSLYRNWVMKDMLMRIDTIRHERTSAGTPVIEAPQDATPDQIKALDAFARKFRGGENAGGAIPFGSKLNLTGISSSGQSQGGSVVDSMKFHNEEMAKAFLMMFINLGSTETGSRALGSSFIEFFQDSQESIADWFCDVFNEHVIEDDVDWNFKAEDGSVEEQVPILAFERTSGELPTADLITLLEKGIIEVDPEMEAYLRGRYHLPSASPPASPPKPSPEPEAEPELGGGRRRRREVKAASGETPSPLALPDRDLRRQPYEHEVLAAVDFAAINQIMDDAVDALEVEVKDIQAAQIAQLHEQIIEAAGDELLLTEIAADPMFEEPIFNRMQEVADQGMQEAVAEAERQGVDAPVKPDLDELDDALQARARAIDSVLARSLSEAASRQALQRTGGSLTSEEVAAAVKEHLENLSGSYLHDQLNGTLNQALNSGRKVTMRQNNAERIYASELLDANTCPNCISVDGTEYDTVEDAEAEYSAGGYNECKGGPRCRGTLVAIYGEGS